MSSFDLEALLTEISSEAPCGEDVSYDIEFLELEQLAQGTAETQIGDHIHEGEEPDWKAVRTKSLALLERSRDLRLILYLTISKLCLEGLQGFYDGLSLLVGAVERYWDQVYPQLDPDDDNDPMERMNIIACLSPPPSVMSDQDAMKFLQRLMGVPLCTPDDARLPQPTLRDMLVASGELTVPESEAASLPPGQLIEAAFDQADIQTLQVTDQLLHKSIEHVQNLDRMLIEHVGSSMAPNFNGIEQLLKQMQAKTGMYLERRGYGAQASAGAQGQEGGELASDENPEAADAQASQAARAQSVYQGLSGQVRSNQDVHKALDMIIVYYEQNEPSSPVPLLLKRAKRLVGRSFVDIIRNISPDAMSQVQMVSGEEEPSEE